MLEFFAIELPKTGRQPRTLEFVLATIVAILGSYIARAVVLAVAAEWSPVTGKYPPFHHQDYLLPTIAITALACAAWPASTLISTHGRRLFLAVVAAGTSTFIALDVSGDETTGPAVTGVAVAVHIAIALVIYPSLVFLSPQWPLRQPRYEWEGFRGE
jgi:hypothetical protein